MYKGKAYWLQTRAREEKHKLFKLYENKTSKSSLQRLRTLPKTVIYDDEYYFVGYKHGSDSRGFFRNGIVTVSSRGSVRRIGDSEDGGQENSAFLIES